MTDKFTLTVSDDDLKHTPVMGSTRDASRGMSVLTAKLVAEHERAGGRVVLFDKGSSFDSLVGQSEADAAAAPPNPFAINKP